MTVSHAIVILFISLCQLWSKSFLILSLPIVASVYKPVEILFNISLHPCTAMWLHLLEINSSSVHTYIFVCFIRNYYIGLLANNATWCQNRGCICISSTRRTYSRIHAVSCIHPVIQTTTTIILWTELFPKKRREKIQREILQRPHSSSNPRVSSEDPKRDSSFYMQSSILQINSIYRINSTRNTRFNPMQAYSSNCSPCIQAFYTAESSLQASYSVPSAQQ